jgi:hypothetical protein
LATSLHTRKLSLAFFPHPDSILQSSRFPCLSPALYAAGIGLVVVRNSFHLAVLRERSASGGDYQGECATWRAKLDKRSVFACHFAQKAPRSFLACYIKAGFITLRSLKNLNKAHLSYLWATKSELPRLSEWNSATSAYGGK